MPGDISRSYKGPKDGSVRKKTDVEGWTTEELLIPNLGWEPLNEQAAEHPPFDNPRDPFAPPDRLPETEA